MRDYTYQDMLRMQEEAAVRVREMKKRATLAMDDENEQPQKKNALPDEVRHISYPVEIEKPEKKQEKDEVQEETDEHPGIFELLSKDKDALLILSLIAVLSSETQDYLMSCALMYLLL